MTWSLKKNGQYCYSQLFTGQYMYQKLSCFNWTGLTGFNLMGKKYRTKGYTWDLYFSNSNYIGYWRLSLSHMWLFTVTISRCPAACCYCENVYICTYYPSFLSWRWLFSRHDLLWIWANETVLGLKKCLTIFFQILYTFLNSWGWCFFLVIFCIPLQERVDSNLLNCCQDFIVRCSFGWESLVNYCCFMVWVVVFSFSFKSGLSGFSCDEKK